MTELLRWLPWIATVGIVGVVCGVLGWLLRDEEQHERERVKRLRAEVNAALVRDANEAAWREHVEWRARQRAFEEESG